MKHVDHLMSCGVWMLINLLQHEKVLLNSPHTCTFKVHKVQVREGIMTIQLFFFDNEFFYLTLQGFYTSHFMNK